MKSSFRAKASVVALAALLASCASTGVRKTPETAANAQTTALTAADADGFVAAAEKELFDFSVFNAQVQWINNTYITDDTDAVAARVGAQGTEMSVRSEEHTSELQSLMRISYAVFCLKKKKR